MQAAPVVAVRDWGEALRASFAGALGTFMSAIPRILGFVLILVIGWFVASLIAKAISALLHAIRFNDLARRAGVADFVQKMGLKTDAAGAVAGLAKWFVRLIVLVVAFDALGLPAVSGVLQQFLVWLPNLLVALVVLVIGGLLAGALGKLVRGATAEAGFSNPDTLATVARVVVWAFAIVVAVNQLGIATELINTLLIGVVGALALGTGLAFGLGGREKAAEVLSRIDRQASNAGPKLERAAGVMQRQAQAMGSEAASGKRTNADQRSGTDRRGAVQAS